jgi:hypothetical protein
MIVVVLLFCCFVVSMCRVFGNWCGRTDNLEPRRRSSIDGGLRDERFLDYFVHR